LSAGEVGNEDFIDFENSVLGFLLPTEAKVLHQSLHSLQVRLVGLDRIEREGDWVQGQAKYFEAGLFLLGEQKLHDLVSAHHWPPREQFLAPLHVGFWVREVVWQKMGYSNDEIQGHLSSVGEAAVDGLPDVLALGDDDCLGKVPHCEHVEELQEVLGHRRVRDGPQELVRRTIAAALVLEEFKVKIFEESALFPEEPSRQIRI